MHPNPSILTNMAFHQSRIWREAVTTLCRAGESPDDLNPLGQALRLLRMRSRSNVVVTMGSRPSLAYGLLCGLLQIPSRQIMAEVFLDTPRPTSLLWRAKTALFRWISRRSLGILTNSSVEVGLISSRFDIPRDKLRFVPMYTIIEAPRMEPENDGYVFSVGRTLRDLDTLLQAARHIDAPLRLVVGKDDRLPAQLPPNVQVFREIPLEECYAQLRRSTVVAIPLLPAERSTGQVVLFEAMALGKPVVVTRVAGTLDYIRDGENGLLVEPRDAAALADAVNRLLHNHNLATHLAQSAFADCLGFLSADAYAERLLQSIRDLAVQPD
jgi:glycosyltransferase involved in cell wall biosynthesis